MLQVPRHNKPGWVKRMRSGLFLGQAKTLHWVPAGTASFVITEHFIRRRSHPNLENLKGNFFAREEIFENLSTLRCFPPRTLLGWALRWLQEEPRTSAADATSQQFLHHGEVEAGSGPFSAKELTSGGTRKPLQVLLHSSPGCIRLRT